MDAAIEINERDSATLSKLAEIGKLQGDAVRSNGIRRLSEAWNVPKDVPDLMHGAKFLFDAHEAEMEPTNVSRTFNYRPWDGAYCATKVMEEVFGGSVALKTFSFFGPEPPRTIAVTIGAGETVQVPWGDFELAQLPKSKISFGTAQNRYGTIFSITVTCPKKYEASVLGFFALVERECELSSIYKGKAFVGTADSADTEFIDLRGFDPTKIVYSGNVEAALDANVWVLIEDTERCQALGQKLKRAVCVHGPYGTGKTLFTKETARRAIANGWTFIQAKPGDDLGQAMETARLYEPAVVVYEDIDTIAKADQDDATISRLLDHFDGLGAKDTKVITLLTTNNPDRLHKGMMRPGRLDAFIEIADLDRAGVEKLIRVTAGDRLGTISDSEFDNVAAAMTGYLPSFIVESVGVATKYAIAETKGQDVEIKLSADNLVNAALELRPQHARMADAQDNVHVKTLGDLFEEIVLGQVVKGVSASVDAEQLTSLGSQLQGKHYVEIEKVCAQL